MVLYFEDVSQRRAWNQQRRSTEQRNTERRRNSGTPRNSGETIVESGTPTEHQHNPNEAYKKKNNYSAFKEYKS